MDARRFESLRTMRPIPFDSSHLLIGSDDLHLFAEDAPLSLKSQTISDWFWYRGGSLKKYCIIIDQVGKEQFGVGELEMKTADYSSRT